MIIKWEFIIWNLANLTNMKKTLFVSFLFITSTLMAQYGTLGIGGGYGRTSSNLSDIGFARLGYTYHLNNYIAIGATFDYSGAAFLAAFEPENDVLNYSYEADFNSSSYSFIISPEVSYPLKIQHVSLFLKPQLGLARINSISDLYKVGTFTEDDYDEDDLLVSNGRLRDDIGESGDFVDLFLGLEGGVRVRVGKRYFVSLFVGINNLDYSHTVNQIIKNEPSWNPIDQISSAKLSYAGISVAVLVNGVIWEE